MDSPVVTQAVQRQLTTTLFLAQGLFNAATIAAFTLTPIVAAQMTGNDSLAGLPATVLMLARAAASYPFGRLIDRTGRRTGFSLGFLVAALGLLTCAFSVQSGSFLILCLGSILTGFGRAASEQTRFAAAEIYEPSSRARAIGTIVFAGTIGAIGGPLVVGPASHIFAQLELNPDSGPFVVAALLICLAAGLLFTWLRPDPKLLGQLFESETATPHTSSAPAQQTGWAELMPILQRNPVQLALLAMVVGQLVMTLLMVITPLHMRHHAHDNNAVAWVIAAHTLGMFGLAPVTGWLVDRLGRIPMIFLGALLLIIASLLTPISTAFTSLASALFVLGLGWSFAFIAASSLLSDTLESHERGRIQGFSEMFISLAAGLGSLGTGSAFAFGGIAAVGAVGLAFSLALLTAAFWIGRLTQLRQT